MSTKSAMKAQPVLKNTFTRTASTTTAAARRTTSIITKGPRNIRLFTQSCR